jgi:hypothetical protein
MSYYPHQEPTDWFWSCLLLVMTVWVWYVMHSLRHAVQIY